MPFPLTITAEVSALNTALNAAMPLENASRLTMTVLSTQAVLLAGDVETALAKAAGELDDFAAPDMAPAMVQTFLAVVDSADTQVSLADLAGVAGRVASNLTNG